MEMSGQLHVPAALPSQKEPPAIPTNSKIKVLVRRHQHVKTYGGVEVELHALVTSALEVGMIRFTLRLLYPRGNIPRYP